MKIVVERDTEDDGWARLLIEVEHGGRTDISHGDYVLINGEVEVAIKSAQEKLDKLMALVNFYRT